MTGTLLIKGTGRTDFFPGPKLMDVAIRANRQLGANYVVD
jgi:hypothetical protein